MTTHLQYGGRRGFDFSNKVQQSKVITDFFVRSKQNQFFFQISSLFLKSSILLRFLLYFLLVYIISPTLSLISSMIHQRKIAISIKKKVQTHFMLDKNKMQLSSRQILMGSMITLSTCNKSFKPLVGYRANQVS